MPLDLAYLGGIIISIHTCGIGWVRTTIYYPPPGWTWLTGEGLLFSSIYVGSADGPDGLLSSIAMDLADLEGLIISVHSCGIGQVTTTTYYSPLGWTGLIDEGLLFSSITAGLVDGPDGLLSSSTMDPANLQGCIISIHRCEIGWVTNIIYHPPPG